jgi:hypothetical protein
LINRRSDYPGAAEQIVGPARRQRFASNVVRRGLDGDGPPGQTQTFGDLQMNLPRLTLSFVLFSLVASSTSAQKRFFFDQPEPFKRQIKLPANVVQLLRHEIAGVPGCNEKPPSEISPSFIGSRINLGAHRQTLIALAYDDCGHSADRFWFWILLKTAGRYRILLRAGTDSVTVRNTRTHRFPDLETNVSTGEGNYSNVYEFDGTVYKVDICTHTSFATRKTERVPCRPQ